MRRCEIGTFVGQFCLQRSSKMPAIYDLSGQASHVVCKSVTSIVHSPGPLQSLVNMKPEQRPSKQIIRTSTLIIKSLEGEEREFNKFIHNCVSITLSGFTLPDMEIR